MADVSNDTVTATGTTTARSLATRFAEIINVMDCGAVGNGSTDDRAAFATADTAAGGNLLAVPPGTYKFSSDITIASRLWLPDGAILKPDSGVTVTLSEVPVAESWKIFDNSNITDADLVTKGVRIAQAAEGVVNVEWWGPAGNGTTDDWKPLQSAFYAAQDKVLVFPHKKTYAFEDDLTIKT